MEILFRWYWSSRFLRDEGDQQTKLPEVVHPIMQDRREAQISSVLLAMRSLWIAGGSVYISINLKMQENHTNQQSAVVLLNSDGLHSHLVLTCFLDCHLQWLSPLFFPALVCCISDLWINCVGVCSGCFEAPKSMQEIIARDSTMFSSCEFCSGHLASHGADCNQCMKCGTQVSVKAM